MPQRLRGGRGVLREAKQAAQRRLAESPLFWLRKDQEDRRQRLLLVHEEIHSVRVRAEEEEGTGRSPEEANPVSARE